MRESRICFTILEDGSIPLDGDWMVVGKALGKAVTDQLVAAIEFRGAWARAEAVMATFVPPA